MNTGEEEAEGFSLTEGRPVGSGQLPRGGGGREREAGGPRRGFFS